MITQRVIKDIGFIFSYMKPISPQPLYRFKQQVNDLLVRLNKHYPTIFPYTNYAQYCLIWPIDKPSNNPNYVEYAMINEPANLERLKTVVKDLDTLICIGEKAHFAIQKMLELYPKDINIIKTRNLVYPISRHIKRNYNEEPSRFRTNMQVINIFKEIDQQLKTLLKV